MMWLRGACALFLLGLASTANASVAVANLLKRAEEAKSSDPVQFQSVLTELEKHRTDLLPVQIQHVALLHAYADAFAGQYGDAIEQARAVADNALDNELRLRAALLVANSAAVDRQFSLALKYVERGLELINTAEYDAELRQRAFGVAALVYNQFDKHDLALRYADLGLKEEGSPRQRCGIGQNRMEALFGKKMPSLEAEIHDWIDYCDSIREHVFSGLLRTHLARRLAESGSLGEAISLLEENLKGIEATRYAALIAEVHSRLAEYQARVGNADAAASHARRVLALTSAMPYAMPRVQAFRVLYEQAEKRKDIASAFRNYRAYAEARHAAINEAGARELAFQQSRNELQQKNLDIALLSKQNEVLRLEQKVARTSTQNTQLLVALLALLLTSGLVWAIRARRNNQSLRRLAETDSLTGLSNRRHFRAKTEAALAQCEQRGRPVALLLFDLDHFKQINDQCGHSVGDWVLREVARVVGQHCRGVDVFGRIGGEEFAIALIDCELGDAERIAEECRRAIAEIDAQSGGCTLPVSASIGCVGAATSGYNYEVLIAHADAAMYRSKVAGRNRVSLYEPSLVQVINPTKQASSEAAEAALEGA